MKAVVCTKSGAPEVLKIKDKEKPIPKDGQILIRISATTVTAGDCQIRNLKLMLIINLAIYIGNFELINSILHIFL